MIAAYKAGASLYTIACEWKLGKQTVRRKLDEAGVRIRRKGLDDEQVVRAVSGYESGQTIREVAADLGVGHSMVWRALKKAGVELRDNVRRVGRKLSKPVIRAIAGQSISLCIIRTSFVEVAARKG